MQESSCFSKLALVYCFRWFETELRVVRQLSQQDVPRPADDLTITLERLTISWSQSSDLPLGIVGQPFEKLVLKVGASLGSRMLIVPHRQLLALEPLVRAFKNRFLKSEVEMPIEPVIHNRPADIVIVVWKLQEGDVRNVLCCSEHTIMLLQLRKALFRHGSCSIIGREQEQRLGRVQRGEFEVVGTDAKSTYVLTCASALSSGRDNHCRHGDERPVVHCTQHKRLGPSSAAAGNRDTFRIDVRQTGQEIEGANGIVRMQSHRVLQV